jgi:CubicO group peptidase (beta-lactamase class C family)
MAAKTGMNRIEFKHTIAFIEQELNAGTFPGAALAIMVGDQLQLECCWGRYSSVTRRDLTVDASTVHMLYSFSKGITSTVFAMYVADGAVDLDAPVSRYIPEYRNGLRDQTLVRHLLTHAAGIPSALPTAVYTEALWREAVRICCVAPVEWKPGSRTLYHGSSGHLLAAEVIRRIEGMEPWEDICRRRLFGPLGAKSLSFCAPKGEHVALTPQPDDVPCPIDGAHFGMLGHPGGGCFGTPLDMLKVLRLNLQGGMWEGQLLIAPAAVQEMHRVQYGRAIDQAIARGATPAHEPYGLGWLIRAHLGEHWFGLGTQTSTRTFGHAGIDTVTGVGDPERALAIAFLTTDSPKPSEDNTVRIRNTVIDRVVNDMSV